MNSTLAKAFKALLNVFVYPLMRLVPRQERLWVFGTADDDFAGNSRYLYLWMLAHRPDIDAVWITGKAAVQNSIKRIGGRACLRWSIEGIRTAARARVFFFTHTIADINAPFSAGSVLVNLWHGVGIKKTHYEDPNSPVARFIRYKDVPFVLQVFRHLFLQPDILATTSTLMSRHFSKSMRIPEENCLQIGYSRFDAIVDPKVRDLALSVDNFLDINAAISEFREVYIYMPTWRDTGREFLKEALPNLRRLSEALGERQALLYVKLHPFTKETIDSSFDNIREWPQNVDFYPLLAEFAGLITDYSSVLYDYILVRDSGVLLYTFDYESYVQNDRGLALPRDENVIGEEVRSFDAMCDAIAAGRAMARLPAAKLALLRERFWGGTRLPSSPEIIGAVEKKLASEKRDAWSSRGNIDDHVIR